MRLTICLLGLMLWFGSAPVAEAQFGNSTLFEPEISVVNSGVLLDAQATVSHDRKYVTLTMRPQQSQLLSLQTFEFQRGGFSGLPGGVIGGVNPVVGGPLGSTIPQAVNRPMRVTPGNGGAILIKRGITPLLMGN
jgi:hypothetical protein